MYFTVVYGIMKFDIVISGRKEITAFLENSSVKHDGWTIRTKVMNELVVRKKHRSKQKPAN